MGKCRICSIATAVGFAKDIAQQENIEVKELNKIVEDGYEDEEYIKKALENFVSKVSEKRKNVANEILCFAFENHDSCKLIEKKSKE